MEEHQVYVGAGQFAGQHVLDVGIHIEHVELRSVRVLERGGHLFAQGDALIFPGGKTVGERSFARVGDHAVQRIGLLVRRHGFLQVRADLGKPFLARQSGPDPARIDVAVDALRGVAGQPVVKEIVPGTVPLDETELQPEVVVEAV